MKIEKSNNPAAVGALVLVLVLIVGRIVWMVVGHNESVAAATTAASTPAPAAALAPAAAATPAVASTPTAPAQEAARAPSAVSAITPVTTRNPFTMITRPALAVARPDGPPPPHAEAHSTARAAKVLSLTTIAPLPMPILKPGPGAVAKQPTPNGPAVLPPHRVPAQRQAESLPLLTLTATVGGAEPAAVVQMANPQPLILHVGDLVAGMRVVAIHEREVVFARGNGFWTLPLQSAEGVAAGSISAASPPTASKPVVSVATPEEEKDALQSK